MYPLQGRPGANRKGVRLAAVFALVFAAVAGGGCAGPLAFEFGSASIGTHADGTLRHPAQLPFDGEGYIVPAPWRTRHANFATEELVGAVVRTARAVERSDPGGVAAIGDLSRRSGGDSAEHKSHQSGRDVDVFFYGIDREGRPVRPGEAMFHFAPDGGRAVRWSPPHGVRAPAAAVPAVRFDARRNWAFVRALLADPENEVQWIFIHRGLAAALLQEATREGDDPALVARASFIMKQPSDAEVHDDHMHVRLYCAPSDRRLGCVDRGPVRWWKKMWKYMSVPYGRPSSETVGADAIAAFGRLFHGELPLTFVAGDATS
ncbi:MAG TPA: penicillin-insensitive murein endopeptidase [Polyangia bacterium]|nr:penicillin-insensitive murein endopeptidase [Polyangia bacterium]